MKMTKSRGSVENVLTLQDSDDNLVAVPPMRLEDNTTSVQSLDSVVIHDNNKARKEREYVNMIPPMNTDSDQMVDMRLLAIKAAEEFANLANENDKLFKENSTLKEKYDDITHEKMKIEEELNLLKNRNQDEDEIKEDMDVLKAQAENWELEKKLLLQQLQEAQNMNAKTKNGSKTSVVGKTALKLKSETSEDGQRLMMESLAKITRYTYYFFNLYMLCIYKLL